MSEEVYEKTLLCCRGTGCTAGGSESIYLFFLKELKERGLDKKFKISITGCHGLCEMGPIVVVQPEGVLYCHTSIEDVSEIIDKTLIKSELVEHLLYKNPITSEIIPKYRDIPFYKYQKRILLRNCGVINPEDIEEYIKKDGYLALRKALLEMSPLQIINEVKNSGLRGRGGAGFPTGLKWEFTKKAKGEPKYIVCNADEGDPGAFMDRSLIEGDSHSVLEGMLIAGHAIGAKEGYIYCRAEYPLALHRLGIAIKQAKEYGFIGKNILGTDFSFDIRIKQGAGAFVCGEETALLASIEGRRGEPRPRPPFPATSGLWGKPTNINNVKSYSYVPQIILNGADWFASMGTERTKGTMVFALTGKVISTGLAEVPVGMSIGELVFDVGGGVMPGKKFKAIQIGGPLGGCLPIEKLNTPIDYEPITESGAIMGSGGMIVVDNETCMVEFAKFFLQFANDESCGQCVPCRIGGQRMLEILTRITEGRGKLEDLVKLERLSRIINQASLCALGQLTPNPVLTTLKYFRDEYLAHIIDKRCPAGECETLVPASCINDCPAEVNVPVYIGLISEGKISEALAVHRKANPFPSICSRICPHPCEEICRRGEIDEPIATRALKRFMSDYEKEKKWIIQPLEEKKEQKIAIIGSGPAGLTAAYRLARLGYKITIFEAKPEIGGMLIYGIPDYRLPREIVRHEIDMILKSGDISIKTNTKIGEDLTLSDLKDQGFYAIFISIGSQKSVELKIPGENIEGVISELKFLDSINSGKNLEIAKDKKIAIIGGGNVAIDAARSAIRLSAKEVHIIYRRRKEDMPAQTEEIREAEEEGVIIHTLLSPKAIEKKEEKLKELKCFKMSLTRKTENGKQRPTFGKSARKRPFVIENSEISMEFDLIIKAIGQRSDLSILKNYEGIEVNERGNIVVDPRTFVTSKSGIFAGGDIVTGPASAIEAIAAGNKAAKSIHNYLQGNPLLEPAKIMQRPISKEKLLMTEEDGVRPRQKIGKISPDKRVNDFREIEKCFDKKTATLEAKRCLRCDLEEYE